MKNKIGLIVIITALVSIGTTLLVNHLAGNEKNVEKVYVSSGQEPVIRQVSLPEVQYPDFTYAAETGVKAVVHVKVEKRGQAVQGPQSLFDFFFGYGTPAPEPRPRVGAGSGVIISRDGYIVTATHVIDGADEVVVTLDDKRQYEGKVVGKDPATDIALLKIEASDLPFVSFGDSDELRLGQWVIAIGNPYDLRSTITAGIVSAKGRSLPSYTGEFKIEAFIQTDAAVNPGNSGGALVNAKGELVGINTAIATRTGSFSGYSFAVPSTIVRKVVDDIRKYGIVQRALLGITMQDISGDLAKEKDIAEIRGVYIHELSEGGAAQKAGIKPGDILLEVGGVKVNSGTAVQEQISRFSPGDKVDLTLLRGNREVKVNATLQNQSGNTELIREGDGDITHFLGAQLKPAAKETMDKLKIRSGIEVVSIGEGKLRDAGIRKGFIITHVNQKAVSAVQQFALAVQTAQRGVLIEGRYPDGSVYYYALGN
ncbi:MAG: Do family serine endopeptidase [Bacteroidales bacterium]|jgi:Do/DeqQ family serine protease|nr:Do family serine endopeptidase [Bacteroidales bacterium]MDD2824512.1 Do family serine endopeptidase [Bacteroidales bacterium]MDD3100311.1 Do family serine endopeptidase [Bacteroidales bacterium]MDD3639124.1 Do family serine endopeptidase [Bacteroidales bacterium]MDD3943683.1 Do family serine endopeptidase [Bacteroidales bacterium]